MNFPVDPGNFLPCAGSGAVGAARRFQLAILFVCVATLTASCAAPPAVQPIPFNHRIHAENALTCDSCHGDILEQARADMPRVELCASCHSADITQNPAARPHIEKIRWYAEHGSELPWLRLYKLQPHVYFSHRRHTKIAELDCSVCHGNIGESQAPPSRPVARTLDMDGCMDCHEQRGIKNECTWCHR